MKRANNACEIDGCGFKHLTMVFSVKSNGKTLNWFEERHEAENMAKRNQSCIIKPVKVIITIAHLDHDETNHDVDDNRLMAMCQLHHLRYDAAEKSKRKKNNSAHKKPQPIWLGFLFVS